MNSVTLATIKEALENHDPELVQHMVFFQENFQYTQEPVRENAPTFERYIQEINSVAFKQKTTEEQMLYRQQQMELLESEDAEVPLSETMHLHEVIMMLWDQHQESPYAHAMLIGAIQQLHYQYGTWRAIKKIFKLAEESNNITIFAAIAARIDQYYATASYFKPGSSLSIKKATIQYMALRSWRYLRKIGEQNPVTYVDTACEILASYTHVGTRDPNTHWLLNHILYHESKKYKRATFNLYGYKSKLTDRAFNELWRRTPRPLFTLLLRCQCGEIAQFAARAIKSDFSSSLREIEIPWIIHLPYQRRENVQHQNTLHELFVWTLENSPHLEQENFSENKLHEPVLQLLESDAKKAIDYAASYARTHVRDLPFETLLNLLKTEHETLHKLATDLLLDRDPRKEIGLEHWGKVLETDAGYKTAAAVIRKHFSAKELTLDWFKTTLIHTNSTKTENFLTTQLPKLHPIKKISPEYFIDLIDSLKANYTDQQKINFALEQLEKLSIEKLATETLQRFLVHPFTNYQLTQWVHQGRISPTTFGADWLKTLAFHPDWEASEWVAQLKKSHHWAKDIEFNQDLCIQVHAWLSDVRSFLPNELGFEWLMQLVQRSEPLYHNFAVDNTIKAFLPADFAGGDADTAPAQKEEPAEDVVVDFDGASFVFTGKMATMVRSECQKRVTASNGKNASGVTKNLSYLVIGDEGSSFYGSGRKGSKQVKAEKLIEDGAEVKIISETAFLQMLAGEQREFSEDSITEGCETLWDMMTAAGPIDAPLAKFALKYIRLHHPEICLRETDRPVDPGAEMPDSFMTFEQVKSLFSDDRKPLRDYALELAHYEFARWAPSIEGIIEICESPHPEVRTFVAKTLTCADTREHTRYRLDPAILTPEAVYSFCESNDAGTRALGMQLIDLHPRLRLPEELFRLTESPDRLVRAFSIRAFWSLYHDRGITSDWKPSIAPISGGKQSAKLAEEAAKQAGTGAPEMPKNHPADDPQLYALLRRILFEIPPGRPEIRSDESNKLKPLPSGKAKLLLIETLRDLAIKEPTFAAQILPLLKEFMGSRGKQEMAACLVAVTRINQAHPKIA